MEVARPRKLEGSAINLMFSYDVYDGKAFVARAGEELTNELQMFAAIDVWLTCDEGFSPLNVLCSKKKDASCIQYTAGCSCQSLLNGKAFLTADTRR